MSLSILLLDHATVASHFIVVDSCICLLICLFLLAALYFPLVLFLIVIRSLERLLLIVIGLWALRGDGLCPAITVYLFDGAIFILPHLGPIGVQDVPLSIGELHNLDS